MEADKIKRIEKETKEEQRILASNAWHLARYVMEHDFELTIPEDFNMGEFLWCSEHYLDLDEKKKIQFINQYMMLEKATKNVTARTLVATRIHGHGFFYAVFGTSVGRYLFFLAIVTLTFVILLILNITTSDNVLPDILIPFWAAGLGTCVFLLRITQEKLSTRQFDPAFIPSQLIRLSLGILAGGLIVLFPDLIHPPKDGSIADEINIGQSTLAFILGYAVDIFYSVLDNIGGRVKNRD
jgi:hypothetical protein